jgi:hypothetical protein
LELGGVKLRMLGVMLHVHVNVGVPPATLGTNVKIVDGTPWARLGVMVGTRLGLMVMLLYPRIVTGGVAESVAASTMRYTVPPTPLVRLAVLTQRFEAGGTKVANAGVMVHVHVTAPAPPVTVGVTVNAETGVPVAVAGVKSAAKGGLIVMVLVVDVVACTGLLLSDTLRVTV